MNQEELLKIAKKEMELNNIIGCFNLPETEKIIKRYNRPIPVKVQGCRTYYRPKKKINEYLVVRFYPGISKEEFVKIKLN